MKMRPHAQGDMAARLRDDRAAALALTPVSREIAERLDRYVELLLRWQQTTQLIGDNTIPNLWTRHIADSLQLLDLAPEARVWADLGSGAGLPGLVLACALADRPGAKVHLIESQSKKSAFLREATRLLDVPAIPRHGRIESVLAGLADPVDVVTARALAPLVQLLDYAHPLLKRSAKGLFPKGQDVAAELTEAARCWIMEFDLMPSKTSRHSSIVLVSRAERRQASP